MFKGQPQAEEPEKIDDEEKKMKVKEIRDDFAVEVANMERLQYPHIMSTQGCGWTNDFRESGQPFMLMPVMTGGNLKEKMTELDPESKVVILQQAAQALAYMHKQKVNEILSDCPLLEDGSLGCVGRSFIAMSNQRTFCWSMMQ